MKYLIKLWADYKRRKMIKRWTKSKVEDRDSGLHYLQAPKYEFRKAA